MKYGVLVDMTKCMGCRGCQVACKQQNKLEAEKTEFFAAPGGYQNPAATSASTYTLVAFNEVEKDNGDLAWVFSKQQCMHCEEPSCASACIVGALEKQADGSVTYDTDKCIGCRYCMLACPFGVPSFEWAKTIPYVKKCELCYDRRHGETAATSVNGQPLSEASQARFAAAMQEPACTKACATGALQFGERDALLKEAKQRISEHPELYVDHIYGEHEVGGTSFMYLSAVPFEELGFPMNLGTKPYPAYSHPAKAAVPPLIIGVGALLGGVYWYTKRRERVAQEEGK